MKAAQGHSTPGAAACISPVTFETIGQAPVLKPLAAWHGRTKAEDIMQDLDRLRVGQLVAARIAGALFLGELAIRLALHPLEPETGPSEAAIPSQPHGGLVREARV